MELADHIQKLLGRKQDSQDHHRAELEHPHRDESERERLERERLNDERLRVELEKQRIAMGGAEPREAALVPGAPEHSAAPEYSPGSMLDLMARGNATPPQAGVPLAEENTTERGELLLRGDESAADESADSERRPIVSINGRDVDRHDIDSEHEVEIERRKDADRDHAA